MNSPGAPKKARSAAANRGAHWFGRAHDYGKVPPSQRILVALVPPLADWEIVRNQGWYRIPCKSAPPSNYGHIAFYFGNNAFGERAWQISHWATIEREQTVTRNQLFPDETSNAKADKTYFKLSLGELRALPRPIVSPRKRYLVFLATTLEKMNRADELNDLWHQSPLEDEMWHGLKTHGIEAERQWFVKAARRQYCLDFAVFCARGGLNIECDGDSYHANSSKSRDDNARNNALTCDGWAVLRFNTEQIVRELNTCLHQVRDTISQRGGVRFLDGHTGIPAPIYGNVLMCDIKSQPTQ